MGRQEAPRGAIALKDTLDKDASASSSMIDAFTRKLPIAKNDRARLHSAAAGHMLFAIQVSMCCSFAFYAHGRINAALQGLARPGRV